MFWGKIDSYNVLYRKICFIQSSNMSDMSVPDMLLRLGMYVDMDGQIVKASKRKVRDMTKIWADKQKAADTRARLQAKLEERKKN